MQWPITTKQNSARRRGLCETIQNVIIKGEIGSTLKRLTLQ
jgi:hypothetical protein